MLFIYVWPWFDRSSRASSVWHVIPIQVSNTLDSDMPYPLLWLVVCSDWSQSKLPGNDLVGLCLCVFCANALTSDGSMNHKEDTEVRQKEVQLSIEGCTQDHGKYLLAGSARSPCVRVGVSWRGARALARSCRRARICLRQMCCLSQSSLWCLATCDDDSIAVRSV